MLEGVWLGVDSCVVSMCYSLNFVRTHTHTYLTGAAPITIHATTPCTGQKSISHITLPSPSQSPLLLGCDTYTPGPDTDDNTHTSTGD